MGFCVLIILKSKYIMYYTHRYTYIKFTSRYILQGVHPRVYPPHARKARKVNEKC